MSTGPSSSSIFALVKYPEQTKADCHKKQGGAGGIHSVGSHEAVDLEQRCRGLRIGKERDDPEIAHRQGGSDTCGKPEGRLRREINKSEPRPTGQIGCRQTFVIGMNGLIDRQQRPRRTVP